MERIRLSCRGGEDEDKSAKPRWCGQICTYRAGIGSPHIPTSVPILTTPAVTIPVWCCVETSLLPLQPGAIPRPDRVCPQSTTVIHTAQKVIHTALSGDDTVSPQRQRGRRCDWRPLPPRQGRSNAHKRVSPVNASGRRVGLNPIHYTGVAAGSRASWAALLSHGAVPRCRRASTERRRKDSKAE